MSVFKYGSTVFDVFSTVLHTVCRGILLGYVKFNAIVLINAKNKMEKNTLPPTGGLGGISCLLSRVKLFETLKQVAYFASYGIYRPHVGGTPGGYKTG